METQDRKEFVGQLKRLSQEKESVWLEEYAKHRANRKELKRSQKIALQILRTLRKNNSSQKDLAASMGVSPEKVSIWVKGKERFSSESIAQLEKALGVKFTERTVS